MAEQTSNRDPLQEANLLAAAAAGNLLLVEQMLVAGVDVNAVDQNGRTPLILAAAHGHRGVVDRLLAAGATPLMTDQLGTSATDAAAESGSPDVVRRLLHSGGELDLTVLEEEGKLSFVQERSLLHPKVTGKGVETFDFHSTLVLTEGFASDAARTLKLSRKLKHMHIDAYDQSFPIGKEAYLSLRLKHQHWSILLPINIYLERVTGEVLAKCLSQRLATRSVYFETDDTQGQFFYHLFGNGLSLEWLANDVDEGVDEYRELTEGKSEPHPEAFYSRFRKIEPAALLNPEAFTNDFFENLGLRVPAFGPGTAKTGETVHLSIPGYAAKDFAEFILLTS